MSYDIQICSCCSRPVHYCTVALAHCCRVVRVGNRGYGLKQSVDKRMYTLLYISSENLLLLLHNIWILESIHLSKKSVQLFANIQKHQNPKTV